MVGENLTMLVLYNWAFKISIDLPLKNLYNV